MLKYSAVRAFLPLAPAFPTACAQYTQVSAGGETQDKQFTFNHRFFIPKRKKLTEKPRGLSCK